MNHAPGALEGSSLSVNGRLHQNCMAVDIELRFIFCRLDTALVAAICTEVQQRLGPASFDAPAHAVDQETRVQVRFPYHP